ncbi:hypothetical protein HELRODRAFT_190308 [Helobdella robusta]|uniref:Centromere protein C n=1 Tax=Helobdella robusta TaxID=6412 RepID=T1FRW1_HELRO|nr:hypothetical protein HELRODRAFT_190308 [Helobdella robusta]ESO09861.1 hypothetical protein HELRODRAFT_190308 [Helobdella robusta]
MVMMLINLESSSSETITLHSNNLTKKLPPTDSAPVMDHMLYRLLHISLKVTSIHQEICNICLHQTNQPETHWLRQFPNLSDHIPSHHNQNEQQTLERRMCLLITAFINFCFLEENAVASPLEAPILSPNVAVQPEEANVAAGLRRSKRNKVATLDWYKGERVRYKWTPEGFEVDSIIPPVFKTPKPTARRTVRKLTKQTNKRGKNKMKLVVGNDQSDLSAHVPIDANDNSFVSSSVIDVFDLKSHRIVPRECVMKYCKSALRNCQTKEPANEDDPLVMLRGLSTDVFCAGILEIRPLQEKSMQLVKSDLMIFNVSFGKLEVTVCETKLFSSSGDFFYVPPGNKYSLRNLRNETARLSFVNIKNFLNIYSVPF